MNEIIKPVLDFLVDNIQWVLLLILVFNLTQRRQAQNSMNKRLATLFIACLVLLMEVLLVVIKVNNFPAWLTILAILLPVCLGIIFRKKVWPFKLHCVKCGKRLDFTQALNCDENKCLDCFKKDHPELYPEKEEEEKGTFSWDLWEPEQKCVLCYILRDNNGEKEVLLIEKKKGFGAGKLTGPGGHIEDEETSFEACIREIKEEVGLTLNSPKMIGAVNFNIPSQNGIKGYIFVCDSFEGTPIETDEAKPFWAPVSDLPWDKMFQDDEHWLPTAIEGKSFDFYATFDDEDKLVDYSLELEEENENTN